MEQNLKVGPKNTNKYKISQNLMINFSQVSGHISMHLICQSKSPIWTAEWLKGFQNRSIYARDIGSFTIRNLYRCNTNRWTPCRLVGAKIERGVKLDLSPI